MHCSRRSQQVFRQLLVTLLLLSAVMITGVPAQARVKCSPAAVWLTLPDSSQVVDVNAKLMTDSGPTEDPKAKTITYSRRWQGARFSRSLSITIIIYPTTQMAADRVKSYGASLLKSKEGQKVALGDLGYRTNQIKRPYYLVHKGRFVVSYYTSYPGRRTGSGMLPDLTTQEKTIREILNKITQLPCYGSTGQAPTNQTPPPPNNCPTVRLSVSPAKLTPAETVSLVANATDPDGNKLTYDWKVWDFNNKKIRVNWVGPRQTWRPPGLGTYFVYVEVSDGQCNVASGQDSIIVTTDPNQINRPPTIKLTAKPNPAMVNQKVLFTAVVSDPDGDAVGQESWLPLYLYSKSDPVMKRVGNTFTLQEKYDQAGRGLVNFEVEDIRGAAAIKTIQLVVTDPNQLLSVHLSCNHPIAQSICRVNEGGQITFTATTNNPKQESLTYAWSVNGKKKKSWEKAHVVWKNIPYNWNYHQIKVQVWKKSGETATDTLGLEVIPAKPTQPPANNSKPKVSLNCLTTNPQAGKPIRFKATVSDADAGDKLSWNWRLDGKAVGWSSLSPNWSNSTAGKHSITITVSDGTDKTRVTKTFTVQAPVTPPLSPATKTIIQSAEFVDSATSSAWGSRPKSRWRAGEEIFLLIEMKPVSRSHNLEIIWKDAAGKIHKRDPYATSANSGWNQGETIWSSWRSTANDAIGTWTVDILVDGRLDRVLSFKLDRQNISRPQMRPSPPSRQPGSKPNGRPAPTTSGSTSGGPPQPPSTWKPVF